MSSPTLPAGLRCFSLDAIAPEPWANGGGWTRQIAAGDFAGRTGAAGGWSWRVSVADLTQPGPFSVLSDVQRCSALLGPAPVTLRSARETLHFARVGDTHAYAGDVPLQASLPQGPSRFFNVMTRRGAAQARVTALQQHAVAWAAPVSLLLVAQGAFRVVLTGASPQAIDLRFEAGAGLLLEGLPCRLALEALTAESCLLQAEIHPPRGGGT